jgi:hypothetical protein
VPDVNNETQARKPRLVLATSGFVNTVGTGLFLAVSLVYFTEHVGLGADQVGAALTLAGGIALLANVPAARLAMRLGTRNALVMVNVAQMLVVAAFVFVNSLPAYCIIAIADLALANASSAIRTGLIAEVSADPDRVLTRAWLRSASNVGLTAGTTLAIVCLAAGSSFAIRLGILADAATYLISGALVLLLPNIRTPAEIAKRKFVVMRDRWYMTLVGTTSVVYMSEAILTVGIPIWIVRLQDVPVTMVGVLMTLNTLGCALLQPRVASKVKTADQAKIAARLAGAALLVACCFIGLTSGLGPVTAELLLAGGALAHLSGELLSSAASWSYFYELAAEDRQVEYQAASSMSYGLATTLAPIMVTGLVIGNGQAGWMGAGILFLLASCALPIIAANKRRELVAMSQVVA